MGFDWLIFVFCRSCLFATLPTLYADWDARHEIQLCVLLVDFYRSNSAKTCASNHVTQTTGCITPFKSSGFQVSSPLCPRGGDRWVCKVFAVYLSESRSARRKTRKTRKGIGKMKSSARYLRYLSRQVRFPNRTCFVSIAFIKVFKKDPLEYAFGILHWLGNRT